jgi:hypothetical protein
VRGSSRPLGGSSPLRNSGVWTTRHFALGPGAPARLGSLGTGGPRVGDACTSSGLADPPYVNLPNALGDLGAAAHLVSVTGRPQRRRRQVYARKGGRTRSLPSVRSAPAMAKRSRLMPLTPCLLVVSDVRQSGVRIPVSVSSKSSDGHRVILRVISHNRLEEGHHDDRHHQYRPCPPARGTARPGVPNLLRELLGRFIAQRCQVVPGSAGLALGHASATTTLSTYAHLRPTAEDRTRQASGRLAAAALGTAAADCTRTEEVL